MSNPAITTKSIIKGGTILVTALAWNTAIKGSIDAVFPMRKDTVVGYLIYAITITILTLIIISLFNYFNGSKEPYKITDTYATLSIIGDNGEKFFKKRMKID